MKKTILILSSISFLYSGDNFKNSYNRLDRKESVCENLIGYLINEQTLSSEFDEITNTLNNEEKTCKKIREDFLKETKAKFDPLNEVYNELKKEIKERTNIDKVKECYSKESEIDDLYNETNEMLNMHIKNINQFGNTMMEKKIYNNDLYEVITVKMKVLTGYIESV